MTRIIRKIAEAREVDLEAWETALRVGVLSAGARVLEQLLEGMGSGQQKAVGCQCGVRMESRGVRSRELVTVLGRIPRAASLRTTARAGRGHTHFVTKSVTPL